MNDLLDDFTNASGLKDKSKLLISGKNILRRLISSILGLEEGIQTYLPILVPQDLKRRRKGCRDSQEVCLEAATRVRNSSLIERSCAEDERG